MKYGLLIAIGLIFWSCFDEGDCLVTATNYMELQFKKRTNHDLDSAVAFTSIYISGTDTLLHDTTSTLVIPVDINHDTTMFVMQRIDPVSSITASDTLQVTYAHHSTIISRDCGAFTFYTNLRIVKASQNMQIKTFSTSLLKDPTSSAYAVNYQIFY